MCVCVFMKHQPTNRPTDQPTNRHALQNRQPPNRAGGCGSACATAAWGGTSTAAAARGFRQKTRGRRAHRCGDSSLRVCDECLRVCSDRTGATLCDCVLCLSLCEFLYMTLRLTLCDWDRTTSCKGKGVDPPSHFARALNSAAATTTPRPRRRRRPPSTARQPSSPPLLSATPAPQRPRRRRPPCMAPRRPPPLQPGSRSAAARRRRRR